jgi:hypothetical protein
MSVEKQTPGTIRILEELRKRFPDTVEFRKRDIDAVAKDLCIAGKHYVPSLLAKGNSVRRGVYNLSAHVIMLPTAAAEPVGPQKNMKLASIVSEHHHHISVDPTYVPWGSFKDVTKILKSELFYPTYISGLSGNGKTVMVEQACAKLGREYIRVNISNETDEDDLIGGFRLVDGETVFSKGPVIKAMETGAVLLLDEIDRGTNKILCLQSVLEGKSIIIKKTGEVVSPAHGFTVMATANTKGAGSDESRFTGTSILDDAFLERFTILIEQSFATPKTEKKIVMKHMEKLECIDEDFADNLVKWADVIRKTYYDDGIDEVVSTRRLCHIVQTYSVFGDKLKAIQLCVNRFDEDTNAAFIDLYTKVDSGTIDEVENNDVQTEENMI